MGMSTSIVLLRDKKDLQYQKNLKVLISCQEADIDPPKEVDDYFGGDGVDNDPDFPLEIEFKPREWSDEMAEGVEIDVDKLPPGVKTIRFCNSW